MSNDKESNDQELFEWEAFVNRQVERQYGEVAYTGKRPLDFTPFAAALAGFSERQAAAVGELISGKTIIALQPLFANGQLSTTELVLFYLQRIGRYDDHRLNSFLALNPDALTIAQQLDEERAAGQVRSRLHGIPVLLKDNIATADQMPTTAGAAVLANASTKRDAFIARRLREAGAVILGKGNLSEWANFMTSTSANGFSVLGGQARNPYGRFDVGGSSAGSAVAVAADLVTVSIGSETAGSIVYPASQNAVVGLKPSLGAVSRDHIVPITAAMDTAGPMGRTVTDVAVLFSTIVGYDPSDGMAEGARPLEGIDFTTYLQANGLHNKRIGLVLAEKFMRVGDDEIVQQAVAVLKAAGAELIAIEDFEQPEIDYLNVLLYGIQHDLAAYLAAVGETAPIQSLAEVVAFNAADIDNRAPFGQDLMEKALALELTAAEYEALVTQNRQTGTDTIRELLRTYQLDAILSLSNHFTRLYAPAGFPAITVPAGFRATGEPLGVTFVGDYLADGQLLQLAYAFEQASQVRRPPDLSRL